MSTASADPSSDQPQRTSHQPGPLALLAATTIGGVLATRMGKTPFFLAAGAAAIALLRHKKTEASAPASAATAPQSLPPPAPELDIPAQNLVEQWLSQQISREKQAPVIEFSAADLTPATPEDDYRPEAFLLDETGEPASAPSDHASFAQLTEPVLEPTPELEPVSSLPLEEAAPETEPVSESAPTPAPTAVMEESAPAVIVPPSPLELEIPPLFSPPRPPAIVDSAWTLGMDPLPSLNEPPLYVPPAGSLFFSPPARPESLGGEPESPAPSSLFFSAPKRQEEVEPRRPVFSTQMFQGAAFPDEISVSHPAFEPAVPAVEPPAPAIPELTVELVKEPPPAVAAPAAEKAPEIAVEFAAPGDASFDPPLAAAPPSPWQPGPEVFAAAPAFPVFPSQTHTTTSPMVEAEIVLRPRAPTQNSVVAKSKPTSPLFGKPPAEESSSMTPEGPTDGTAPPESLPASKEPKSRSWRSWWRGD